MEENRLLQLQNNGGIKVLLSALGASIQCVEAPDRTGKFVNIALGAVGTHDPSYAGATLAPFAGRISGGELEIDGQCICLTKNDGNNQLHGGPNNLSHTVWDFLGYAQGAGWREARFGAEAADGLDGYPGNRRFETAYRLWDDDRLDVHLQAWTDKPTRVNLSNHAYWNLSGDFSQRIDQHLLSISARKVYLNNDQHLPVDACSTDEAPFDFGRARPMLCEADEAHPQLRLANGLNHTFVIAPSDEPAVTLMHAGSGRRLRLFTDQPCVVVYAGGYLSPERCAVALEAQEHPLAAAAPPTPLLLPHTPYRRVITLRFDTV